MLGAKVTDERAVCFNAIGRFPEVGDEIKNIDFLHSREIQWVLTGRIFKGLRGAETLKLVRSASPSVRIEGFVLCETLCLGVFVAYLVWETQGRSFQSISHRQLKTLIPGFKA